MTYAVNINEFTSWPAETLADMQANRRVYEAQAYYTRNQPAVSAMWQRLADDETRRIARHMAGVAHRAASIQHDRDDDTAPASLPRWFVYGIGAVLIFAAITMGIPAYANLLVWLGGLLT